MRNIEPKVRWPDFTFRWRVTALFWCFWVVVVGLVLIWPPRTGSSTLSQVYETSPHLSVWRQRLRSQLESATEDSGITFTYQPKVYDRTMSLLSQAASVEQITALFQLSPTLSASGFSIRETPICFGSEGAGHAECVSCLGYDARTGAMVCLQLWRLCLAQPAEEDIVGETSVFVVTMGVKASHESTFETSGRLCGGGKISPQGSDMVWVGREPEFGRTLSVTSRLDSHEWFWQVGPSVRHPWSMTVTVNLPNNYKLHSPRGVCEGLFGGSTSAVEMKATLSKEGTSYDFVSNQTMFERLWGFSGPQLYGCQLQRMLTGKAPLSVAGYRSGYSTWLPDVTHEAHENPKSTFQLEGYTFPALFEVRDRSGVTYRVVVKPETSQTVSGGILWGVDGEPEYHGMATYAENTTPNVPLGEAWVRLVHTSSSEDRATRLWKLSGAHQVSPEEIEALQNNGIPNSLERVPAGFLLILPLWSTLQLAVLSSWIH